LATERSNLYLSQSDSGLNGVHYMANSERRSADAQRAGR
jgi:hypothetical protein